MESLINELIVTVSNLSIQSTVRSILASHILPILSNVLYTGIIWILFSIFLYIYSKDKKVILITVLALFISAIMGNEIIRPILFHFREELSQYNIGLYLPEIDKYIFPSGYSMMTTTSLIIAYNRCKDYFKYGIGVGVVWLFVKLNIITSYPIDFIGGIIIGIVIGIVLCGFNRKKEEEEEIYEDLAEKFHF